MQKLFRKTVHTHYMVQHLIVLSYYPHHAGAHKHLKAVHA